MKFEIHGYSGLREEVILMDLKAKVDLNCKQTDGQTDGHTKNRTLMSHLAKAGLKTEKDKGSEKENLFFFKS